MFSAVPNGICPLRTIWRPVQRTGSTALTGLWQFKRGTEACCASCACTAISGQCGDTTATGAAEQTSACNKNKRNVFLSPDEAWQKRRLFGQGLAKDGLSLGCCASPPPPKRICWAFTDPHGVAKAQPRDTRVCAGAQGPSDRQGPIAGGKEHASDEPFCYVRLLTAMTSGDAAAPAGPTAWGVLLRDHRPGAGGGVGWPSDAPEGQVLGGTGPAHRLTTL